MRPLTKATKTDGVPSSQNLNKQKKNFLVETRKNGCSTYLKSSVISPDPEVIGLQTENVISSTISAASLEDIKSDVNSSYYTSYPPSDETLVSDSFVDLELEPKHTPNDRLSDVVTTHINSIRNNSTSSFCLNNCNTSNNNNNNNNNNKIQSNNYKNIFIYSTATSDVPKNVIFNRFEQRYQQYGSEQGSPVVVLPLSETEPLLQNIEANDNDKKHTISLNKKYSSLIFTNKELNNLSGIGNSIPINLDNDCMNKRRLSVSSDVKKNHCNLKRYYSSEETLFQQSKNFQSIYSSNFRDRSITTANSRKQHAYSWYAPVYSALEEELEHESRASSPIHSLANTSNKNLVGNEKIETAALLTNSTNKIQPQLHQTRIRRQGVCNTPSAINNGLAGQIQNFHQNNTEGPQAVTLLGGPIPRRRRFENFLKSLVGRKPSKEIITPPLLTSPTIVLTKSPSENSLLNGNLTNKIIPSDKAGNSTTSLNTVQQKLWNVVPLLKRETSSASLHHEKSASLVKTTDGLRKCETVLALSRTSIGLEPIKPLNRLRNSISTSNANCSRCSSLLSLAATGSRYSLNISGSGFVSVTPEINNSSFKLNSSVGSKCDISEKDKTRETILCKLCLADVRISLVITIGQCGCSFCAECMKAYVEFEICEGAYEISCPDAQCQFQGALTLAEISTLTSASLVRKHQKYRLNREIELDRTRTWCPRAGCETICTIGNISPTSSTSPEKTAGLVHIVCAVQCPTCKEKFCSGCKKAWHSNTTCEDYNRRLIAEGNDDTLGIPFDNDMIKSCPMCAVPIEKDEGCAQMMCKRCKHVFCWYCLASLDDDFLLRHYDKGPCKNKLGHSRASVVWHRAQVIGIFAGFGILLLVASPLLLLAAPCIICCKCRICSSNTKLEDTDADFDDSITLHR